MMRVVKFLRADCNTWKHQVYPDHPPLKQVRFLESPNFQLQKLVRLLHHPCQREKHQLQNHHFQQLAPPVSRMESTTSHIQSILSLSSPETTPKLKYSHVVESALQPYDPGKLSPDLSYVRSCVILTTLGSRDIQACDPGKVSHDLPRDWSSTRSQVTTRSPDQACFRCTPSPLIGMWKTVGTINKSTNQQTSHKILECSKVTHPLPVFVPALKYGLPI